MYRRIMKALLFSLIMLIAATGTSLAQSVPVIQVDGNGTTYKTQLPTNYVQITNLDVSTARIESGSGYIITSGYSARSDWQDGMLVWHGKLPSGFGSRNVTNDQSASLKNNRLPDVTLRFPNGARTSDGTYCDILMTLSEIDIHLGESRTRRINDDTTLYYPICLGWGSLHVSPPRRTLTAGDTAANGRSSGCTTGSRYKITMRVVNRGTSTPVSSSAYPSMIICFTDLDVRDKTIRKSASDRVKGDGYYAEGVEMASGWISPAILPPDTGDLGNTRLVNSQSVNGNTKIKVDGALIAAFDDAFSPPLSDWSSLWSGYTAAVSPQGFSFYWTGSVGGGDNSSGAMGTGIGGQPTVAVNAMKTGSGANDSFLGTQNGATSGVNDWHTNTHLMNSNATYTARPAAGFFLDGMQVDGDAVSVSDEQKLSGRSYDFIGLNKNPLRRRNARTGDYYEPASPTSYIYWIQADFRHLPKYKAQKDNDKSKIRLGSGDEINYQITCTEIYDDAPEGDHTLHDDLAGGILKVDPASIQHTDEYGEASISAPDEDNDGYADCIDIVFNSEAAGGHIPKTVISYTATVDWDRYRQADGTDITNSLVGYNKPEAGGDRTGNDVSFRVSSDIRITKEIRGKLRDSTKKFEFGLELKGLERNAAYTVEAIGGGEVTQVVSGSATANGFRSTREGEAVVHFKATGQQGIAVRDLPVGCTYLVREAGSDHTASYRLLSDSSDAVFVKSEDANDYNWRELVTGTETLDKSDGIVTVAYTNTREAAAVTGVPGSFGWLTAAAFGILGCSIILIIRRRVANAEKDQ